MNQIKLILESDELPCVKIDVQSVLLRMLKILDQLLANRNFQFGAKSSLTLILEQAVRFD